MNTRSVIVPIISTVVFAASCLAAEQFQVPGERDRAVVGTWIMVMMGEGEDLKTVPAEKATEFILRADGSGALREGLKEMAISWGADGTGAFALQWEQGDGKGDGLMGSWKATAKGLRLTMREYEDGETPKKASGVLVLKRKKELPSKQSRPEKEAQKMDRTDPRAVAEAFWKALLAQQWEVAASYVEEDDRTWFRESAPKQIPEVPNPPEDPVIEVRIDRDLVKTKITNWKEWDAWLDMVQRRGTWWINN